MVVVLNTKPIRKSLLAIALQVRSSHKIALLPPHKGYSTKAWNPPKKWVSPERIALTRISAQYPLVPVAEAFQIAIGR
ncbi:hypothetical protein [uncultured Nostoc sp.]|uniref:hypothetical protein n=1 Tax=uncultured Nostoc sp. TaxID=340711 RepID=UPI0035CA0627